MRKYVIMGVQGSGKGTQGQMLAQDLGLVHISVGDIFRWNVRNHTKMGAAVRRTMAAGELIGDDVVESVVRDRLDQHDWNFGFIIDGFPRNGRQAEFFMESYDIDAVIHLELPDDEVRRRVLSRRLCPNCGMDYNLIADRPEQEGRCDICGHELVTRADDTRRRSRPGFATTTRRPARSWNSSSAKRSSTTSTAARRSTRSRTPSARRSACRSTPPRQIKTSLSASVLKSFGG
jgi:adenylate kinase